MVQELIRRARCSELDQSNEDVPTSSHTQPTKLFKDKVWRTYSPNLLVLWKYQDCKCALYWDSWVCSHLQREHLVLGGNAALWMEDRGMCVDSHLTYKGKKIPLLLHPLLPLDLLATCMWPWEGCPQDWESFPTLGFIILTFTIITYDLPFTISPGCW